MSRYAIVDVANLFYRARHVVRGDAFTKAGMALHIVFRSLRRLHREFRVDHMVFAVEGKSWRYSIYPAYKAKRRDARALMTEREREEEDVFNQTMDDFVGFLRTKSRCTVLGSQGVEGDDFIARFIQLHPDDEHYILSGDSDFVQLLAPNVHIYDGVNERLISIDGVRDAKGTALEFSVDPANGKLKVGDKAPTGFKPEEEWWKKALFLKIIRGDPGDGIFSAYPGIRFEGTKKKVGIREAWEDRHEKGFNWNNFMLQRWEKLIGHDADGNKQTQEVRVIDEFEFNSRLIDLTRQPEDVVALMDDTIIAELQKETVGNVGMSFLQFCHRHNLPNLAREAHDHGAYLNAAYAPPAKAAE